MIFNEFICFRPFVTHLGEHDYIRTNTSLIHTNKHGGTIYWRQNPGQRDRKFKGIENIDFFPWSFEKNLEFAKYFDCKVKTLDWDGDRIFAVWERNYVDVICSGS